MSALLLHLRSSTGRWAFLPLCALGLATLFVRGHYWMGIWPETGAAAQVTAFFMSVLSAGFAAWVAATVEVRGLYEQTASSAHRTVVVEATRFGALSIWAIGPYLVVGAVAFGVTATMDFPPGLPAFAGYLLLGLVVLLFALAWGWLIGRVLAPVIGAICAALSWFVVLSLFGEATDATLVSGPPWYALHLGPILVRLAAVVLFAVAVCAIPWRGGDRTVFRQWTGVALAGLFAVFAAHFLTTVLSHREPVAQPLCVRGAIEYCLWPENAKYTALIEEEDRRVAALPDHIALPPRIVDYSLSGSQEWFDLYNSEQRPGTFDPEFDISEGSRWALARGLASAIVSAVFAECSPEAEPDPEQRSEQLFGWLEYRLAGGGRADYRTDAPGDLQAAWALGQQAAAGSPAEQAAWSAALISDVKKNFCRAP